MKGHHIITSPGHPWGWDATLRDYDGAEDSHPQHKARGFGSTEITAVMDLLDQLRDIAEESERDMEPHKREGYAERMHEAADMERKRIREEG